MANGNNRSPWIKFLVCFFLGFFGVHKFMEKKIGMGIIYLFTAGLFGIGWFVDLVQYLIAGFKSMGSAGKNPSGLSNREITLIHKHLDSIDINKDVANSSSNPKDVEKALDQLIDSIDYIMTFDEAALNQIGVSKAKLPAQRQFILKNYKTVVAQAKDNAPYTPAVSVVSVGNGIFAAVGKTLLWALAAIFALIALVSFASKGVASGLYAAIFVALIAPISGWQRLLKRVVKGKVKPILAVALVVLSIAAFPTSETPAPGVDEPLVMATEIMNTPTEEAVDASEPITKAPADVVLVLTEVPVAATEAPTEAPTEPPAKVPAETPTEASTEAPTEPPVPTLPENSTFSIHFLDVGQADAALVECDGHFMLIDGGYKSDSSKIYSILKESAVPKLDIVVASHADSDHIGGIPGAYNYTTADLTLCPVDRHDSEEFNDFLKCADQKGGGITIPKPGDTYPLGSATVEILGVNGGSSTNDTSIILRIVYGETSFLFTGDAGNEAEQAVLDNAWDIFATVLKVAHHGSDGSTATSFLNAVMPQYAVISVGEGNTHGHPTEGALSRLKDVGAKVFRTDMQGDIYCVSDSQTVTMSVTQNKDADVFSGPIPMEVPTEKPTEAEPEDTGRDYVVNKNTKKFHYPSCSSASDIKKANRWDFHGTRDELINKGYQPCKRCKP